MSGEELPEDVRRFILMGVPSIPFLEALLLLRSAPATAWDAKAVSSRLFMGEAPALELLRALAAAHLVEATPGTPDVYRYRPGTPDLAILVDHVASAYAADLVGVTKLIHSRIGKQAQQFADAFRFRRDP